MTDVALRDFVVHDSTVVTPDLAARYARVIGAGDGRFGNGRLVHSGLVASLAFRLMSQVLRHGFGSDAPERTVTVSHRVRIDGAVRAGTALVTEAGPVAAAVRGRRLFLLVELTGRAGAVRVDQHILVGVAGESSPTWAEAAITLLPRVEGEPNAVARLELAADDPLRYADVTGEKSAIHRSADAARAAGFPGILGHGTALLGRCAELAERATGRPLTEVAITYAAPVHPPCALTVGVGPVRDGQLGTFGLRAWTDDKPVVTAGEVVFEPL